MEGWEGSTKETLLRLLVVLCLTRKRAVTMDEILFNTTTSQKSVRYILLDLEEENRVMKTTVKLPEAKRRRNAWFPVGKAIFIDEDNPTPSCVVCGVRPRAIRVCGREICRVCMRGFEDKDGDWIVVGENEWVENEFSRMIVRTEHHMLMTKKNKKNS